MTGARIARFRAPFLLRGPIGVLSRTSMNQVMILRRGRPRRSGGLGSPRAAIMRSSAASHSDLIHLTLLQET